MAVSAIDLVKLTWWQLLLGVCGMGVLIYTLKLTRDANKAAIRAAEAADRAVEITDRTAKHQLRAYVNVAESGVSWKNNRVVSININIKNCGQTPAKELHHWQVIDIGDPQPLNIPAPGTNPQMADLGPGIDMNWPVKTDSLDDDVWVGVRNREIPLFVVGEVRYTDIFDNPQFTRYRMILDKRNDWLVCYHEGNQSS